jgi:hypothetical protein
VQHGRLDLQEAVRHHELADAADGLAARHEALAGGLVGHQVDIALAVLDLLVGHAVELVGHGAQALGQQADLVTLIDSSPVLVLNSVPSAPTMSPRSQCLKAAYTSSPTASRVT